MRGRGGALAAIAAVAAAFVSLDAVLSYLIWGSALGMSDTQWIPYFPSWVVACAIAIVLTARLRRGHRTAIAVTAITCSLLSAGFLCVATGIGLLACGEGGGCSGFLARTMIAHPR